MSYDAVEASPHDGRPILLFEFVQNATTWRYTSRGEDVSALAASWSAVPIEMSEIEQGSEMSKNNLKLSFPRDHAFAAQFVGAPQEFPTSVTLRRGHEGDGNYAVYWKGRIMAASLDGPKAVIDCEPIFTSLRRPGLRAKFQKACRHCHYQRGCWLNKDDFAEQAAVLSLSGLSLTVQTSQPDGWFTGGMVKASDGSMRFVMAHAGQALTLLSVFDTLAAQVAEGFGYGQNYGNYYGGIAVTLYPGCDHTIEVCDTKFNNKPNYGGWKWIPVKNPFGGSSIV